MPSNGRMTIPGKFSGLIKTSLAIGMHLSGLDRVVGARRGLANAPLVIGYHRVVQDFSRSSVLSMPSMLVSARTFSQHLDWIGRRYEFVTLDQLTLVMEGKLRRPRPVAAITFDDGYKDVYLNALPVLQAKGIPSAVFVVTDLVGTGRLQAHDELYLLLTCAAAQSPDTGNQWLKASINMLALPAPVAEPLLKRIAGVNDPFQLTRAVLELLGKPDIFSLLQFLRGLIIVPDEKLKEFQLLDWDMLRQMTRSGVTVGSHSQSHVLLANEDPGTMQRELRESRRELEKQLGLQVRHFAYPDGSFNANVLRAAGEAGYRAAYTICAHRDEQAPLLTISRRMLWENSSMNSFGRFSPSILSCQVNGVFDPARRCRINHWA